MAVAPRFSRCLTVIDLDTRAKSTSIPAIVAEEPDAPAVVSREGLGGHDRSTKTTKASLQTKQSDKSSCKEDEISSPNHLSRDRSRVDVLRNLQRQQEALGRSVEQIQKILQSNLRPVLNHEKPADRSLRDGMSKLPRKLQSPSDLVDSSEVNRGVKILLSWVLLDELSMLTACEAGLSKRLQRRAILRTHQAKVWNFPELQRWNSSTTSSILVLNAESTMRVDLVDFSVQAIQILRQDGIPVIWGLEQQMNDQDNGV